MKINVKLEVSATYPSGVRKIKTAFLFHLYNIPEDPIDKDFIEECLGQTFVEDELIKKNRLWSAQYITYEILEWDILPGGENKF